ncbi:hypothetical protein GEMRC1_012553 [Eukaryota sp. GEM-RC1]
MSSKSSTPSTFIWILFIYGMFGFMFLGLLGFGLHNSWPLGEGLDDPEYAKPVLVSASLHFVMGLFSGLAILRKKALGSDSCYTTSSWLQYQLRILVAL